MARGSPRLLELVTSGPGRKGVAPAAEPPIHAFDRATDL